MKKNLIILICAFSMLHEVIQAQTALKLQAGAGYIEHLSTGIGVSFGAKHQLFFLYGSNLFMKTNEFSSFMLQYQRLICHSGRFRLNFNVGMKGAYAVYTNRYYQWKLATVIPYLGATRNLGQNMEVFIESGPAFNQILELTRREYGEIGTYKTWLPELKIGLLFKL